MKKENLGVGCLDITAKEKKYVNQVLKSGRLSYGPFIKKFERKFSQDHGCKTGIMVNSGTSALRIAIACLKEIEKWRIGDEIIVPAVTFVATSNVILQQGLKPVFVDIDSRTYNINPDKIKEKITKNTRAIMVVHLFGQPAEMERIMSIAHHHKLRVIEDSCETAYVKYKGKSVGSFGDITCFSTYIAHLVVTGVGGIAITNSKKYAEVMRSLANHGRDGIYISIDDDKNKKSKELKEIISRRFKFIRPGYSFRVTELEGALGCAQIERIKRILSQRQSNAGYLIKKLKPLEKYLQLPWHPNYIEHAFMMFPVVIKKNTGIKKSELVNHLENKGIETRDMLPLINQPFYRKIFKIRSRDYPIANWINNHGFYIGCHQKMDRLELDYIVKTFKNYFRNK